MKHILVTGADGFIGKALVKRLKQESYVVFEFDTVIGDITNNKSLDIYSEKKIDHVFHLAARSFVPDSWNNPFDFYQTNVLGTTNVLEFCRANKCKHTMISSYVYGSPDYLPIDENHPIKPYNPYCHSKALSESICNFYSTNFNVESTIIRPFNVYGPGQSELFLIPEIIKKAFNDEIIEVMDLLPKRDYIYIDDLVDALILTMNTTGGIYNIGSGYSISVEEIVETIIKISKIDKSYNSNQISRKNEIFDVIANIEKAKMELNWRPKTDINNGISDCISFFLAKINNRV
ncbi:MAG: NAD(P)-dependent oxidoreductase [Bacteroidota bacterium]